MEINLALLKPVTVIPNLSCLDPMGRGVLSPQNPAAELPPLFENHRPGEVWCLDLETKGDYGDTDSCMVGCALASPRGSVYINFTSSHPDTARVLAGLLVKHQVLLIAHNLFFDAGWFMRDMSPDCNYRSGLGNKEPGLWLNWHACTYALYRLLASEGYPGQQYGLKKAQLDLLGWTSSNESALDQWLIGEGHIANISKSKKDGYYYYPNFAAGQREPSETVPAVLGEDDRFVSAKKEMMHLAPPEILGHYARLDAISTLDLYTHVLEPVLSRFEGLQWYMHELYMRYLYLLVWQKVSGVTLNQDALDAHRVSMEVRIKELHSKFIHHPEVAPHIAAYNQLAIDEHLTKEPKRIKGEWPPKPPATRVKKDGTITAAYLNYEAKLAAGPETSLNWLKWNEKLTELTNSNQFNLNSGHQKAWLFYERMGYPIRSTTESGLPATDDTALKQFGEPGRLLSNYVEAEKELAFNASLRNVMNQKTGRYHPSFKVPGTHTGRLAGAGGFNFQNPPKSLDYLACFTVEEPYVLITCDHASLEDYVLAELSRDASLWAFYGPGSRKGDCMYLSVGSRLPVLGQKIREAGYDPDKWTPDSVKAAKKTAGKWRQVAKRLVLSAAYGAGPGKIHMALLEDGIDVSFEDVRKMHKGFWELRQGVKVWEKELKRQWTDNEGWLLNGMGRPICLEPMREKDLVNGNCLAADTLVLTNNGIKPIVDVTVHDLLWDGVEWVSHQGLLARGNKEVIECNGVRLTADHEVLTENGWKHAGLCTKQELVRPNVSWKEVWRLCYYIGKQMAKKLSDICKSRVSTRY